MSRLIISTSLTPNIVMHVVACSGVAGKREYGEKFAHTVTEQEKAFVHRFRKDFAHRPPIAGGPFFNILFQIPSYFHAESLKQTIWSYDLLLDGLQGNLFGKGISPEEAKALDFWSPKELRSQSLASLKPMLSEIESIINQFKAILVSYHNRFYRDHWNKVMPRLMAKAERIQASVKDIDVIGIWSKVLGKKFPYPRFVIYLYEAGTGSSSLMAEKIAMPSTFSVERAIETILYEVGIHFIAPGDYFRNHKTAEFFMNNMEKVTRIEEAAICYLKPTVYKQMNLKLDADWHVSSMKLKDELAVFSEVWESGEPTNVIEAILKACEQISV